MKILVDLTYIHEEYDTGLANSAFNLLSGMREAGYADRVALLVEQGFESGFADRIEGFRTIPVRSRFISGLPFTRSFIMRRQLEDIIRKGGYRILLSPYMYDRSLTTNLVPCVGVIHDTYQFEKQKSYLHKLRFRLGAVRACNRLCRIVTISQCAKERIEALGYLKAPVEVIYNSITSTADPAAKEVPKVPYILNVNTILPHKNLITLVRALALIKDSIPHRLVVKGRRTSYWNNTIAPFLKAEGLESRVELIERGLSRQEMDRLYVNADIFVTPSMMEGFGMTPIEAALAGVPVICNELPTLVESTRGLATYYSPASDAHALAEAIMRTLEDREQNGAAAIRQEYRQAYSPILQARSYIKLFETLLEER